MFLIGLRLMELDDVAVHFPDSALWQFIGFHSSHIPWVGCSLNDIIHPSFAFLTGASLVFSVTGRSAKGQSHREMTLHALRRSIVLIFLGIFLRSQDRSMTNWTFDETLTQTGLGYMAVYALAFCRPKTRWIWFTVILVSHWLIYALYPIFPPHPHPMLFNVPAGWNHDFTGFFAHWNHNHNAGWVFDRWLLNLFPRSRSYYGYLGGYASLNFITTIGTMILGLTAGSWLKQADQKTKRLLIAGVSCLTASLLLHFGGICPIVKRLWTPAWVFLSGGISFLILAALYEIVDVRQWRRWTFPFMVIGMNSLAFYVMRHTLELWLASTLMLHFGRETFEVFGEDLRPVMTGGISLFILWLIVWWMYRRKLFLRL